MSGVLPANVRTYVAPAETARRTASYYRHRLWWSLQALHLFGAAIIGAATAFPMVAFGNRVGPNLLSHLLGFLLASVFVVVQARLLRAFGHPLRWWIRLSIAASLVSWLLVGATTTFAAAAVGYDPRWVGPGHVYEALAAAIASGTVGGITTGVFQWFSLRRHAERSALWVPVMAAGTCLNVITHLLLYLGIGALLGWVTLPDDSAARWAVPAAQWNTLLFLHQSLGFGLAAFVSGLVTNTGLLWLLAHPKPATTS